MFISFSIIIILTNIFINNLPSRFDKDYINTLDINVLNIVDAHRQIIWGFAFDKFRINLFLDMVQIHQILLKESRGY